MIYIGIDPEPSGAFSIWDLKYNKLYFGTSHENIKERVNIFRSSLMGSIEDTTEIHYKAKVFIEDAWGRPSQDVRSTTKYMKSFGAWLGILYTMGFGEVASNPLNIIPASVWKKELELSSNKIDSYNFAIDLIKDPNEGITNKGEALNQIANSFTEKQMYDRCEAFLISYYGRYFYETKEKK